MLGKADGVPLFVALTCDDGRPNLAAQPDRAICGAVIGSR